MFSGEVAHKHAVYEENGERNRQKYYTKYEKDDVNTDNDSKESKNGTNSSYTKTINDEININPGDDDDDDNSMDNNYNCHYKIKAVQMSAIRCRLEEQQHEERKLYYQQQKQQHLREDGAQSVINLARSNALLDAMCASEAAVIQQQQQHQQHHHYALSAHSSHIAYTGAHQPNYPLSHTIKPRAEVPELTSSHYSNSSSPHTMSLTSQQQASLASASVAEDVATTTNSNSSSSTAAVTAAAAAAAAAASRRDHNIDYSTLFVQLSGTLPTLYRCVNCNKIVSNRWHHANIHRPQSHVCPVCGQKFTRRDNMKAHCKIKHADIKDHFFSHYVHM